MNEEEISKAVDHIQYVLTYGLRRDVTEEEIKNCEKLMRVFLTPYNVKDEKITLQKPKEELR